MIVIWYLANKSTRRDYLKKKKNYKKRRNSVQISNNIWACFLGLILNICICTGSLTGFFWRKEGRAFWNGIDNYYFKWIPVIISYFLNNLGKCYLFLLLQVSIPSWFTMDTRLGSLSVHLDTPQCFSAEMYAVDLNISGASDELKVDVISFDSIILLLIL